MPSHPNSDSDTAMPLVLVTGASSYLGAHIVRVLLARGYAVRAAVRSPAKAAELRASLLSSSPTSSYSAPLSTPPTSHPNENITKALLDSLLTTTLTPDISSPSAFSSAIGGVSFVIHTASPSILRNPHASAREITRPAVDGTLSLLNAAREGGRETLRRVVITGSVAAFAGGVTPVEDGEGGETKRFYTEDDWDPVNTDTAETGVDLYRASKVLAERAAWAWYKSHKTEIGWDLTVLLPGFMFGPPLYPAPALGGTHKMFLDTVVRPLGDDVQRKEEEQKERGDDESERKKTLASADTWLDVRDAAEAHVRALERGDVGGERVVLVKESYVWQEWVDAAWSVVEGEMSGGKEGLKLERGFPELTSGEVKYPIEFDTSKEHRLLGMVWRGKEQTVRDLLVDGMGKGWI